jgi:hypothetical protein
MAIYANYISQKGTKLSQKRPDVHTRPYAQKTKKGIN